MPAIIVYKINTDMTYLTANSNMVYHAQSNLISENNLDFVKRKKKF